MRILPVIIIITFIITLILFLKLEKKEVKYIKSDIDNKEYLVRDLPDKQKAANTLAKIRKTVTNYVNYLYENREKK